MSAPAQTIFDFQAPEAVSILTPLLPFYKFSNATRSLLFALVNTGTVPVHLIIETSEDGVAVDRDRRWDLYVAPGDQGSLEIGPELLRSHWRLSAETDPPFNATTVKWCVRWRSNNL